MTSGINVRPVRLIHIPYGNHNNRLYIFSLPYFHENLNRDIVQCLFVFILLF